MNHLSDVAHLIFVDRRLGYAVTDGRLEIVGVYGCRDMFGPYADNWQGRSLFDLAPELIGSEDVLGELLAGRLPRFDLEWVNRETGGSGATVYLNMVELPYRPQGGEVAGLIHIMQDRTDAGSLGQQLIQQRNELRLLRDEMEQQNLALAAANADLKRLDDLKSIFVSTAAHELRTPLSSIIGYAEMLLDGAYDTLTVEQRGAVAVIERSSQRLLAITNDLLDVTRLETGRVELLLKPTELATLVEETADELKPQFSAKAQHLVVQAAADLPLVWADRTRVTQIIHNLLVNANLYTPEHGHIRIEVLRAADPGFVQVKVTDTGAGLSEADQARIFTRFFRGANAQRTGAVGTGLGLYITHALVELHGGRIWVDSAPGHGSTFSVTFPITFDSSLHA